MTLRRRIRTLILVGDPFAAAVSPRESDRGCPFRDVCAAMRRNAFGERALYTSVFAMSGATRIGPLTADDHERLRRRATPTLPNDSSTYELHSSLEQVPLDVRDAGVVLVGTSSLVEALRTVGTFRDAFTINRFLCFDELGCVARVKSAFRSTYVPSIGVGGPPVSVEGQVPVANMRTSRRRRRLCATRHVRSDTS